MWHLDRGRLGRGLRLLLDGLFVFRLGFSYFEVFQKVVMFLEILIWSWILKLAECFVNVIPTVFVCQFNEDWWVTVKLMDWCLVLLCEFFSLVGLSLFFKTFCEIKYLALVSVTSRLTFVQGMKGGDLSYIWPQSEQTMSCLYKNEMKNVQTWISKLFVFCFFFIYNNTHFPGL